MWMAEGAGDRRSNGELGMVGQPRLVEPWAIDLGCAAFRGHVELLKLLTARALRG
jgi:hypothetical protein